MATGHTGPTGTPEPEAEPQSVDEAVQQAIMIMQTWFAQHCPADDVHMMLFAIPISDEVLQAAAPAEIRLTLKTLINSIIDDMPDPTPHGWKKRPRPEYN